MQLTGILKKIGKMYFFRAQCDIRKAFLTLHNVGHCCTNVTQVTVAQPCVPKMTSGHFCTDVATRMVDAQECAGLVAKAEQGGKSS
jgi:hypothetical protein